MTSTPNPMSSSSASVAMSETPSVPLKRNSNDIGWNYAELVDPNKKDKVKCVLCGHVSNAGIYRLKQHIAHVGANVAKCPKASDGDKAKVLAALEEVKNKKKQKQVHEKEVREEVQLDEEDVVEGQRSNSSKASKTHSLGPMDRFANPIDPDSLLAKGQHLKMRQPIINEALFKERTQEVHRFLARWMYEAGVAFNAIDCDSFLRFVEAVGKFGPGYKPPSQYQLREPLLQEEVERIKELLKKHEEEWIKNGCSIMTDAWSDRKRRSIMNLCIHSKEGVTYDSSKEVSEDAHTGKYIFEYVDECIERIGVQRVVQVVTDNATNNMAAAELLKMKRPNIFWTSCATHTINLMLKDIGNQPRFKSVIDKAKAFTIFVYAHHKTLAMMRKATGDQDLVRMGATRFASSFLTLQSLHDKKVELKAMITSDDWDKCKHSKTEKGKAAYKAAYSTMVSPNFWGGVSTCLRIFSPLVKVLRIVDGDTPSMGFVYGELQQAKEEIKSVFNGQANLVDPILHSIERKCNGRIDCSLHLVGYHLNPYYFYKLEFSGVLPAHIMDAMFECVEKFFPDDDQRQDVVLNVDLPKYRSKQGTFGKVYAERAWKMIGETKDPVTWWCNYGSDAPGLQMMAIKILSLTTSSSGCERNWSTFEGVHTKKRNRLGTRRLNDLVYVQFNAKILNRKKKARDPLLANDACKAQGWLLENVDDEDIESDHTLDGDVIVDEGAIRELDDDVQESEDDTVHERNDDMYEFDGFE